MNKLCHQISELVHVPVCGIYIYHSNLDRNFSSNFKLVRANNEADGSDTALQARRTRVRFHLWQNLKLLNVKLAEYVETNVLQRVISRLYKPVS